jgi:hypothetical protein
MQRCQNERGVQMSDELELGMGGTMLLHYLKEFDDDFTGWSNQDLSFAGLFGIVLMLDDNLREGTMLLRQSFNTETRVIIVMDRECS